MRIKKDHFARVAGSFRRVVWLSQTPVRLERHTSCFSLCSKRKERRKNERKGIAEGHHLIVLYYTAMEPAVDFWNQLL